jgi:hypothetical protein
LQDKPCPRIFKAANTLREAAMQDSMRSHVKWLLLAACLLGAALPGRGQGSLSDDGSLFIKDSSIGSSNLYYLEGNTIARGQAVMRQRYASGDLSGSQSIGKSLSGPSSR